MTLSEAIEAFAINLNRKNYMDEVADELERASVSRDYARYSFQDLAEVLVHHLWTNGVKTVGYNDLKLSLQERRSVNANIDFRRKLYHGLPRVIEEIMMPGAYILVEGNRMNPTFTCYVYKYGGKIGGCADLISISRSQLLSELNGSDIM